MRTDRDCREVFHLVFLERLLRVTTPSLLVLKGGVNLRFFHGSPRYSEDMDLDVDASKLAVGTLRKNGYKILEDPGFRRVLATVGIVELRLNDPVKAKHIDTTQRFALRLVLASGQTLPTKVEFSRRGLDSGVRVARIDPEVARRHGRTAYSVAHYEGATAARQKVLALAGRPVTQARDLFDLYLLDSRGSFEPADLAAVDRGSRAQAIDNAMSLGFSDFTGQVLEFLDEDAAEIHGTRAAFAAMQAGVVGLLEAVP